MATFKMLSTEEFGKLCAAVMKSQRKTDKDLQALAIVAVAYSIQHGDVQPGNRLLDAMQGSLRKDAMVAYLERFGNFAYMKSDKKLAFFKTDKVWDDEYAETLTDGIMWHEAKKAAEPVSMYDVDAAFDKFMKNLDQKINGGVEVKNVKLREHLLAAQQAYHNELHREVADGE